MTRSFIKWVKTPTAVLFQYINLDNDSVEFVIEDETQKTVFVIDSSGYTTFINDKNEIIKIGKFGYDSEYKVQFVFNELFDNKIIVTDHSQFIEAEQIAIVRILTEHNDYFKIQEQK
jgi:hypothetical protein